MVIIDTIHSVPLLPRDRAALLALEGFGEIHVLSLEVLIQRGALQPNVFFGTL